MACLLEDKHENPPSQLVQTWMAWNQQNWQKL